MLYLIGAIMLVAGAILLLGLAGRGAQEGADGQIQPAGPKIAPGKLDSGKAPSR